MTNSVLGRTSYLRPVMPESASVLLWFDGQHFLVQMNDKLAVRVG